MVSKIENTVLYKFTGAGNDFVILDGRKATPAPTAAPTAPAAPGLSAFRDPSRIQALCKEYRTDGLMILETAEDVDFTMDFYNPDGSGGMMCGNGGRCIVAFADYLGMKPAAADGSWLFRAPDGLHTAEILKRDGRIWTVRLGMKEVHGVKPMKGGYFLDTGTRHFVSFVDDVDAVDVETEGRALRLDPAFAPEGTNVNFVSRRGDILYVRTFEKGVEGETLACGTGLTASAVAAWYHGIRPAGAASEAVFRLVCRRGDELSVRFIPSGGAYTSVFLTGPAELLV